MCAAPTLKHVAEWREIQDSYVQDIYTPREEELKQLNLTERQIAAWIEARKEQFDRELQWVLAPYGCTRIDMMIFRDYNQDAQIEWDENAITAVRQAVTRIDFTRIDRCYSKPEADCYIGPSAEPPFEEPAEVGTVVAWCEEGGPAFATRWMTANSDGRHWLTGVIHANALYPDCTHTWEEIARRAKANHLRVVRRGLEVEDLR